MTMMPVGVAKETEIAEAVAEVERSLAPDVVRIRHEIRTNWNDEWAVYFRTLLSDDASRNRLRPVAKQVVAHLEDRLDFHALGLYPYFHVRSESEQKRLRDKAWA